MQWVERVPGQKMTLPRAGGVTVGFSLLALWGRIRTRRFLGSMQLSPSASPVLTASVTLGRLRKLSSLFLSSRTGIIAAFLLL